MSVPDGPPVRVAQDGAVRLVTIDRPHRRNALRADDAQLLASALEEAGRDPTCRVVLLGGSGGWLCAGGDLSEDVATGPMSSDRMLAGFQHLLAVLTALPVPVVVVLEGAAVGAGAALALAADVCVAAPSARIALPWVARGLVPDMGVAYLLATRVGPMVAKRLLLRGDSLGADDALRAGLLTEVDEDPWATARGWCDHLSNGPRYATALTKRLVNAASFGDLPSYLALERSSMAAVLGTSEPEEGIRAFNERRPPEFT